MAQYCDNDNNTINGNNLNMPTESGNTGALTTTFIHAPQGSVGPVLADVSGSNPASGTYRYYTLDHLGSTSGLYDGAKAKISALAYTPYGASYSEVGPGPLPRYTGHLWDGVAGLHLAPYRAYTPDLGRWLSRDPLGMVDGPNVYAYVKDNPVAFNDPLGQGCWKTIVKWISIFGIPVKIISIIWSACCEEHEPPPPPPACRPGYALAPDPFNPSRTTCRCNAPVCGEGNSYPCPSPGEPDCGYGGGSTRREVRLRG